MQQHAPGNTAEILDLTQINRMLAQIPDAAVREVLTLLVEKVTEQKLAEAVTLPAIEGEK